MDWNASSTEIREDSTFNSKEMLLRQSSVRGAIKNLDWRNPLQEEADRMECDREFLPSVIAICAWILKK